MEYAEVVMQRYATKKFDGRMIDDAKVIQLLDIIRYSPSAFNLQPWRIKVVTAARIKEKLLPATNNQPQVVTCSHLLVFCANPELEPLIGKVEDTLNQTDMPKDVIGQYIQLITGYVTTMTPDRKLAFAREQVHIALCNAVNGAKALGFDSCPMGGFDPNAYADMLFLPEPLVPTVLCAIGYAADAPQQKIRFPREEIFF
ncbi:MAG: NAD(P)H-dependent oxidoreductase [Methanoregula sp.]|nr:NAD(P)H-dependent oxidoreductase [Methanoregula sp.]